MIIEFPILQIDDYALIIEYTVTNDDDMRFKVERSICHNLAGARRLINSTNIGKATTLDEVYKIIDEDRGNFEKTILMAEQSIQELNKIIMGG